MSSKEVYSHYLLEVKRDYTKQLCNLLVPVMYEGILSLYTSAKNARKDLPMKMFQLVLSKVPEWNQHTITTEYNRIITKTNCEWINELITAVFISHAKILSSIKTRKKTKTLNLKIPNGDYFIHKSYIECARQFWKNPYLLFDEVNSIEYQRNLRDSEAIIEQCIEETIRKLLPIRNILQQYIAVDEESSSCSSSSDDDIPENNNKIKENKSNTTDQYNEDYVTHAITEKGKKKLENSVKKTLKSSVKIQDEDQFSNYSISQDVPIKKKKNINNNNSGIVNIVSSAHSDNNEQHTDPVNNIDKINDIYSTNLEGDMYGGLDPSNSIEISFNQKKTKKSKSNNKLGKRDDQSLEIEDSLDFDSNEKDIIFKPSSLHEDIVLNFDTAPQQNDKKSNDDVRQKPSSLHEDIVLNFDTAPQQNDKKSNDDVRQKPSSLHEDIVLNFDTAPQQNDKKSNDDVRQKPSSLHEDIVLNFDTAPQQNDKKSNDDVRQKPSSLHEDIVLNFDTAPQQNDKKSNDDVRQKPSSFHEDIVLNFDTAPQDNDKKSNHLSEKRSRSHNIHQSGKGNHQDNLKSIDIKMELDNFNLSINDLNLSSKSDIKKTQTTKKDNQNLDIELLDYVKKTNYDTESLYNISLDFDITDPKTFISSNGSDMHKMPISIVIDESDINNSKTKNVIITAPHNGANDDTTKKTSLKRRSEKKSYSFF
jgi:hypothetical protein